MTRVTELFKIVTVNDYNSLEKIIQLQNKVNFNYVKSGQSLLHKAVEVRSKECFDLLIEIPNLEILKKDGLLSGIQKAIEYYVSAPNSSNEYYVNRLLEKNIKIDTYTIILTIDYPQIFNLMFNNIDKTENALTTIINKCVINNNNTLMETMFKILDESNYDFYNNENKKTRFDKNIFITCIKDTNNIYAFNFLINRGCDWKAPIDSTPLLYYLMNRNNTHLFNTVYFLYESLNPEILNNILYIKNLVFEKYKIYNANLIEYIDKIFKLPIQFNDCAGIIFDCFNSLIKYQHVQYGKDNLYYEIQFKLFNIMFKQGVIKSNPFYSSNNDLLINQSDINKYHNKVCRNSYLLIKILYICSYYGYNITGPLKDKINLLFTPEQITTFDIDKKTFVESFKLLKNTQKTKVKKNINIEV